MANENSINRGTTISIGLGIVILAAVIALVGGALDFKGEVSEMSVKVSETRDDVREFKAKYERDLDEVKLGQNKVLDLIRSIDRRVMTLEVHDK